LFSHQTASEQKKGAIKESVKQQSANTSQELQGFFVVLHPISTKFSIVVNVTKGQYWIKQDSQGQGRKSVTNKYGV
jgi:hypothetical protein